METSATDPRERLRDALAGRYALGRELGRGGMARVYLAYDIRHDRDVAIKVLRPELAATLGSERFLREIRIEARLQHPHILGLIDSGALEYGLGAEAGCVGSVPYYVMPYVAGETLRDRLAREKQLPLDDALQIAREVADALSYAHSHGVVHRDIKPANILLSSGHACVADFGIARAVEVAAEEELTGSGLAVGTPNYMSPEQASGRAAVDGRSDVYALGCVLYEMLAGEPPFAGWTAQAILARHRHEAPRSLRVLRPNLPPEVEAAVETALAKVPADRFPTATRFVEALEGRRVPGRQSGPGSGASPERAWRPQWRARVRLAVAAGVAAAIAGLGLWQWNRPRPVELDPNRVIVFPLRDGAKGPTEGSGEAVATYIGYALEGTAPLKWLDGSDFLPAERRAGAVTLAPPAANSISRNQRAGYYIDGSIVRELDSVTVVLRLHDVAGDSVLRRAGASGNPGDASLPQLGVRAIGDLLPALLEPGRRVDVNALSDRKPAAIANFLQGEREYRRMRFAAALEHYRAAVAEDSALALAALKGAEAANWLDRYGEDRLLVDVALRYQGLLPPRHALFALGLRDYIAGTADSAIKRFRQALALDPAWNEAWMALGEVYYHLLPRESPSDSLAEAAFLDARRADPAFTPPVFHLVEIALRRRDINGAVHLRRELGTGNTDSTLDSQLRLMLDCVQRGPDGIDWDEAVRRNALEILTVAKLLSVGAGQAACAERAFAAALNSRVLNDNDRWFALLGLQSLLIATDRSNEVPALLASKVAAGLSGRDLYMVDASAGAGFEEEGAHLTELQGTAYETMRGDFLWLLGSCASRRGNVETVRAISQALNAKADSFKTRKDSLLARVMAARLALTSGDSSDALSRLQALVPTAPREEITWQPWESLGAERMALAELLFASGKFAEAHRVASQLDSPEPVIYLLYLRPSLALRIRIAEAMRNPEWATRYRARLAELRIDT